MLKCPPGLAWPAQEADWTGDDLPQPVIDVYEAILEVTRDLTPTETSLKMSTTRLTRALEDLQAQLAAAGQDYHPAWDGADGVIVVRIADEQGPLPVGAFSQRIAAARRDQQLLLTESERRVLEDALLARLAQQIHERTVDARDLIGRMNTEMRSRKMSSGKTVGVRWLLADGLDDEQRAVCGLLDADASRLNPDSLARMRGHFAAQIKTARARHRELPYRELLAQVLDYRRWRQFVFQMVSPDGTEEKLTRARHSRLSGGEQSVSLHLPLFAAAHAMLNSAHQHAPRLLALDEAFAGVDDTGRGELMSLAAQFDLDLFMTGYDLWATQAAVRAAAHYDLAHSPIEHTVSALAAGVGRSAAPRRRGRRPVRGTRFARHPDDHRRGVMNRVATSDLGTGPFIRRGCQRRAGAVRRWPDREMPGPPGARESTAGLHRCRPGDAASAAGWGSRTGLRPGND